MIAVRAIDVADHPPRAARTKRGLVICPFVRELAEYG